MAVRTRAEFTVHLRAFRDIWRERQTAHPAETIRQDADHIAAMYDQAVTLIEAGAPMAKVCGALGSYSRQLHGCSAMIEAEDTT